jgi:hypothetical protein
MLLRLRLRLLQSTAVLANELRAIKEVTTALEAEMRTLREALSRR